MKIAILGSSGHIGQSLTQTAAEEGCAVYEFCRKFNNFDEWRTVEPDVVINCTGIGSPVGVRNLGSKIFKLSEDIDNQILDYLHEHDILYIFISSGAIHYRDDCYAIAKRCAELKHRATEKKIVDLRVFNYLSEYINLEDGYLITEIINSIIDKKPFLTNNIDIRKEFISRHDLWQAIKIFINAPENGAYDVYSRAIVGKFDLLRFCANRYGLVWRIEGAGVPTPTNYIATEHRLSDKGYLPRMASLETIREVVDALIS